MCRVESSDGTGTIGGVQLFLFLFLVTLFVNLIKSRRARLKLSGDGTSSGASPSETSLLGE
jgi:hypothetical protein